VLYFCMLDCYKNEIRVGLKDRTIMYGSNCEIFALFLFRFQSEFVDMSGVGFYDNF